MRQARDRDTVRHLRPAADRIGDVHHVVPVLQRLHARKRETDLGVEPGDDQPLAARLLHRVAKGAVLERVHRRPVDHGDSRKLCENRRQCRPVEAGLNAHAGQHNRHVECLGGLGEQAYMELDQVGARL